MKIFLATLSLLAAFTINAFAVNPNTVSPPVPGAPPAVPSNIPPNPNQNNNGINTSGGAIIYPDRSNSTNTPRVDQSSRNCNNLTGRDLITCRQNYQNTLNQ